MGHYWTPADLGSKLVGWWTAQDSSTLSTSGAVTNWKDKSASALTTTVGSGSPTYSATGLNGYPAVSFDGNSYLTISSLAPFPQGTTAGAMASVVQATTNNTQLYLGYGGTANMTMRIIGIDQNKPLYTTFGSGSYGPNNITANTPHAGLANIGSGTTSSVLFSQDGSSATTSTTNNGTGTSGAYIGSSPAGFKLNGLIGELVLTNQQLSDSGAAPYGERQILGSYLNWGWGLQSNLPTSDPFKSAAPYVNDDGTVTAGPKALSYPISGAYANTVTPVGVLGMSAALSGTYGVVTASSGASSLTSPLSGTYGFTANSQGMLGTAGVMAGMYPINIATTGALGNIGPLAGTTAIYTTNNGTVGGGTGVTLFVFAPGSTVFATPVTLVSTLSLSTTAFPVNATVGTPLATITGKLNGDSIVNVSQHDDSDVFRVDPLGQNLLAGANYAGRRVGKRVDLTEVNRGALNSPFNSRIPVTFN